MLVLNAYRYKLVSDLLNNLRRSEGIFVVPKSELSFLVVTNRHNISACNDES